MNYDRSPTLSYVHRGTPARWLSTILLCLGFLILVAGALFVAKRGLERWISGLDRHLLVGAIPPLSVPDVPWPMPTPDLEMPLEETPPGGEPEPTPSPSATPTITLTLPSPVQLRIPALGITRAIINAPRTLNPKTGAWTRDVDILFRQGRKDLVGHWEGSSLPGQEGNMILVGHNYGVGVTGVFVRLGRLKVGQKVFVVNQEGETFTYRVATVKKVKWQDKDSDELAANWKYLSPDGPERLTLVTCGGAPREPFPKRIYVVAEPFP